MYYVIETFDKENHEQLRQALRDKHLEYLDKRLDRILACGAKLADDGSDIGGGVYLLEVANRQEALEFIQNDPFYQHGLFENIRVYRWRKAYFDRRKCL